MQVRFSSFLLVLDFVFELKLKDYEYCNTGRSLFCIAMLSLRRRYAKDFPSRFFFHYRLKVVSQKICLWWFIPTTANSHDVENEICSHDVESEVRKPQPASLVPKNGSHGRLWGRHGRRRLGLMKSVWLKFFSPFRRRGSKFHFRRRGKLRSLICGRLMDSQNLLKGGQRKSETYRRGVPPVFQGQQQKRRPKRSRESAILALLKVSLIIFFRGKPKIKFTKNRI